MFSCFDISRNIPAVMRRLIVCHKPHTPFEWASGRFAASSSMAAAMPLVDINNCLMGASYKRATDAFEDIFGAYTAAMRAGPADCDAGVATRSRDKSVFARLAYQSHAFSSTKGERVPPDAPFLTVYGGESRDVAVALMRAYAAQGRIDGVRDVFHLALDATLSPAVPGGSCSSTALSSSSVIVDAYLDILTMRSNFSVDDVLYVLRVMRNASIPKSPLTYLYLIELHLRMDKDPVGLWSEMTGFEEGRLGVSTPSADAATLSLLACSGDDIVSFARNDVVSEGEGTSLRRRNL